MRRIYGYIISCCVVAALISCTPDAPDASSEVDEASRIYLAAGVGPQVTTRAPYAPSDGGNTPTATTPLNVTVWASTMPSEFPDSELNGSTGTVAIHTRAHFLSGEPQLLGEAVYPQDTEPVYFVGLHPLSEQWTTSDNTHASFTFSGTEDIMFAPMISGAYGIAYDDSPTFHFYHLLTWLRIEMVADMEEDDVIKREEVAEAWGKITSMTIKSKNTVLVDLCSNTSGVTFEGSAIDMPLYKEGSNEVFPGAGGYAIPTTATEVAYVMCEPVEAQYTHVVDAVDVLKPEYTLHIETEERSIDVPIDLKLNSGTEESSYFTGTTMGRQFTLLLNFKMGNIISVAASISLDANSDWFTHGTGTSELFEDNLLDE